MVVGRGWHNGFARGEAKYCRNINVARRLIALGITGCICYNEGSRSDDQSAAGLFSALFAAPCFASPTWRTTTLVSFLRPGKFAGAVFLFRIFTVAMRLYVGNLSYSMTNESLEQLFAEYGQVKSAQVVQDRDTGRSKGFGFVEMADNSQANAAINGLNSKEVDGRALTVNEARPREERSGGGGGRGYGGGGGGRSGGGGGYGGGGGGRRY